MSTTWGDLTDEHEGLEVTFTRETDRMYVEDPAELVTGVFVAAGHTSGVEPGTGDPDAEPPVQPVRRVAHVVAIDHPAFAEPVARAIELRADAPVTVAGASATDAPATVAG